MYLYGLRILRTRPSSNNTPPHPTDPHGTVAGYHNVGGFEVTVEDPIAVQVEKAIQKLEENAFDHRCGNSMTGRLGVVVYYLKKVVFAVFEDHIDTFIL